MPQKKRHTSTQNPWVWCGMILWLLQITITIPLVAQSTSPEDRWLKLLLAMAYHDPTLQEEAQSLQSLDAQRRQAVLQQVRTLSHTFQLNRQLNEHIDAQSPVVLLPLLYLEGEQLLPTMMRKVNGLEHDERQHARYVKVHLTLTPQPGQGYRLSIVAGEAAGVEAEGEQSLAVLQGIIDEMVPQPVALSTLQADTPLFAEYFQAIQSRWRSELGLPPVAPPTALTLDPVLKAYLQEKTKKLSEAYQGKVAGFVYCKLCQEEAPASSLQHTELNLSTPQGTLSGEISIYGYQRCLSAYYHDNRGDAFQSMSQAQTFTITHDEYNSDHHQLTAYVNASPGAIACTDYVTLDQWDYCTQEISQEVGDALVTALTRCVEEEGVFHPEPTGEPADHPEESLLAQRLNEPIGDQEKIKVVNPEGQELARSPGLAAGQPEHFTVTVDDDNQLSVKLSPGYLSALGQTDPSILAVLEQAFNDLLRQARVSFCTQDNNATHCTDQQLRFLQVLNLNVQSMALEAQVHPAMWDGKDAKSSLIPAQHALPPVVTGVADALIERVSDLPQLALMAGGLIINHDNQREALAGLFTPQGWQALKEGIFAEVVATLTQPDKREHAIATASVNLIVGFYALLSYGPQLIAQLTDKIEALARKVDQAPHLAKYLKKIVQEAPSEHLAKKLEQLLDNLDATALERLLGRLPEDKLDELVTDLADNPTFRRALTQNEGLVDSWKELDDLGNNVPTSWKKDPDFLQKFDGVVKNDGLNDHIFKGDPKFEDGRIRGVVGVHSKDAINIPDGQTSGFVQGDLRYKAGTKNPINPSPDDYYTVKVEIYGKKGDGKGGWLDGWISKKSTFFPDSWSKSKIQAEVANAFRMKKFDRLENGADVFRGTGSDGSIIEIVIRGGIVKTAYPIIL